jgi:hypothetical protein
MRSASKSIMFSALAAALVLGAAEPLAAQATPLGAGGGRVLQDGVTRIYAFECILQPDGSVAGKVISHEPVSQSFVHVNITSAMHIGGWLAVAGEITAAVNTPPQFSVGQTMFATFADNGTGRPVPDQVATGLVPLFLGNLTIQQIIGLIGPPPAVAFSPFISGNIQVF